MLTEFIMPFRNTCTKCSQEINQGEPVWASSFDAVIAGKGLCSECGEAKAEQPAAEEPIVITDPDPEPVLPELPQPEPEPLPEPEPPQAEPRPPHPSPKPPVLPGKPGPAHPKPPKGVK